MSRPLVGRSSDQSSSSASTSATAWSSAARTGSLSSIHDLLLVAGHADRRLAAHDQHALAAPRPSAAPARAPSPGPSRARRARLALVELGLDHVERAGRPRRAARRRRARPRRSPPAARRRGPCRGCRSRRPRPRPAARGPPAAARPRRRSRRRRGTRCRCRHEDARPGRRRRRAPSGSTSSQREEEAVARLAPRAEVAAGVVLEHDGEVHRAADRPARATRRSPTCPASARSKTSPPGAGLQPHAAAAADLDAVHRHGRAARGPRALPAGPLHRRRSSATSRTAPCRRISSSGVRRLGALEDLARARVGGAHLGLLLVGQAEDVEGQQLVDLPAVEQVAGALGRDPRVVGEDDRRGQQRVARPRSPTSTGHCPAFSHASAAARSAGRVGERHERAVLHPQHARASSRTSAAAPPRAGRPPRASCSRPAATRGAVPARAPRRPAPARPRAPPSARVTGPSAARAGGHVDRDAPPPRPARRARSAVDRDLALGRLLPGQVALAVDDALVHRLARLVVRPGASTTCRKRTRDRHAAPASPSTRHCVRMTQGSSRAARLAVRARVDAAEGPALPVLERRARVGPQHVALVEHRVGDPAHGVQLTAPRPVEQRVARSPPSSAASRRAL